MIPILNKIKFKYKLLMLALLITITVSIQAKPINYTPKALQKELDKNWSITTSSLMEISSLSDQLITEGKFFHVEGKGYVFVGRVRSCRAGGCSANREKQVDGAYEYFDTYIIYNTEKVLQAVRVYNYQASHGHEITSKGWLKQFVGFTGEEKYEVGKDVDSISGATISVYAITDEVNYITELLKSQQ